MASEEDKGVMRALLLRMRQVDYRPNAEERLVLAGCENRALRYGLSAGAVSALGTAVALRRFAGTGLLGTIFRTTSVAMAGTTAAVAASQYTSGACLCDLLAISATSPLGGEAARLLSDSNPTSKHLQALPNKARWAPETLPRLPMPAHTRESLHTSVAARPAQAAAPAPDDVWGGTAPPPVFGDLLRPDSSDGDAGAASAQAPRRPGDPPRRRSGA